MLLAVEPRELASLLSLISHEIRSPLGVLRGYLRMLNQRGSDLSDQHQPLITAALKASERVAELLTQVSTLAQLHQGETSFDFTPVSLRTIVDGVASAVMIPADPVVRVHVQDIEPLDVVADTGQLQTALASLLSSVIRAQGRETTIEISARGEPRDGENGVAIQMTANEVSETQVSTVPLDVIRGGLGVELPIAAAIIDVHCGQVREVRTANGYAGVVVWLPTEVARVKPGPTTTSADNL
jgi:signal transduction histidine kinase